MGQKQFKNRGKLDLSQPQSHKWLENVSVSPGRDDVTHVLVDSLEHCHRRHEVVIVNKVVSLLPYVVNDRDKKKKSTFLYFYFNQVNHRSTIKFLCIHGYILMKLHLTLFRKIVSIQNVKFRTRTLEQYLQVLRPTYFFFLCPEIPLKFKMTLFIRCCPKQKGMSISPYTRVKTCLL